MFCWQRMHIVDELKHNGIDIEIFNPLLYVTLEESYRLVIEKLRTGIYDMFLTCDTLIMSKELLSDIRRLGIPSVCFRPDNLLIPFIDKEWAKEFDLFWLTSIETSYLYEKWGANYIFLPYAANPYKFKPTSYTTIRKVGFIGTPYGSRINMMNTLIEGGIPLDVYCKNTLQNTQNEEKHFEIKFSPPTISTWKSFINLIAFQEGRTVLKGYLANKLSNVRLHEDSLYITLLPKVSFEKMLDIYSSYTLSLSSTSARNTDVLDSPLNVINLRAFEIPMVGGLQFCRYSDELSGYFEEDKEIVFYRSHDELVDKASYYITKASEDSIIQMKKAARLRAENEHTWLIRFTQLFRALGLKI